MHEENTFNCYSFVFYNNRNIFLVYSFGLKNTIRELEAENLFDLVSKEQALVGLNIENWELVSQNENTRSIFSLFGEKPSLMVISSLENCSACREEFFQMIDNLVMDFSKLNVYVIFTGGYFDNVEKRFFFEKAMASKIRYEKYFDQNGQALISLGIGSESTPVLVFVDESGKIIDSNFVTKETMQRSYLFAESIVSDFVDEHPELQK